MMSGSSAFELRSHISEPLTGRKWEYHLYPVSYEELEKSTDYLDARKDLENRLVYGFYPDVINNPGEEREILNEITQSYLFRDILAYGNIKKPDVLEKILRALAFQVGNEVSYSEIGQLTGVEKYGPIPPYFCQPLFLEDKTAAGDRLCRGERRADQRF